MIRSPNEEVTTSRSREAEKQKEEKSVDRLLKRLTGFLENHQEKSGNHAPAWISPFYIVRITTL